MPDKSETDHLYQEFYDVDSVKNGVYDVKNLILLRNIFTIRIIIER